ncbi:MAG: alanine--tRNA ligase [Eubacterium sp.]|nr:alanine--tRNA ligase [Eubacterium sp.]
MKSNGLNDIRKAFREFYVSKGHYPAKSASLIPQNDKSLLLINSGMAPLKRYFAGVDTPPAKRMTTCQKCLRTGDIDNVGKTARHGTFFEMLGNFSFGDYFKEQSLTWGWEFIKDVLELPEDKVWATVYEDDDQAVEIWKKLGMPEERIVRLGKDDNFWEIGLGPCGPCSEIYYDRGPEYGCGKPDCKPGCDCDRYVEFWNHVFTQFSKEEDGSYSDLAHPNIDTGMGLERIACIMQGVDSIFDIDTIRYILDGVLEMSGVEYEKEGTEKTDVSVRIVTDHLRAMVFMIADGIIPSNEGRGYVLRRLIRRAARHGKLLGIKGGFLTDLADRVIEVSGEAYPELVEKKDYIKKNIDIEEKKFQATLDQGVNVLDGYIKEMQEQGLTVLDGEKTFKLYDTYGFPPEVTEDILADYGFTADQEGFAANMQKQKEQARAGRRDTAQVAWEKAGIDVPQTHFLGYRMSDCEGTVLAVTVDGEPVETLKEGQTGTVYLDQTVFYAESGGQIYDTGFMYTKNGKAEVTGVTKSNNVFAHEVKVVEGTLSIHDNAECRIDQPRRHRVARNHTATHLLQAALRQVVGDHVQQAGSYVSDQMLRFDFTHYEALTKEQIAQVEALVNEKIDEFLTVTMQETTIDEARKKGAMALFGEKYGDVVRMVSCGDFSIELCGGTHVGNTGEIGAFKLLSETGVASGVRRIEAVTGTGVMAILNGDQAILEEASQALKCAKDQVPARAKALNEELKAANREIAAYKKAEMGSAADSMLADAKEIGGVRLVTRKFEDTDVSDLRTLSDDLKKDNQNLAMVFAAVNGGKLVFLVSLTDDLVAKGLHAGKMIKEIAAACGGGGGGKANMAQAGAKDPSKLEDAFKLAEELIK